MSTMPRLGTWDRRASLAVTIRAGLLTDQGRVLVSTDPITLQARAYLDDGAVTPTPLAGAISVPLGWSASAAQWAADLPYLAAMDALASVRVVVTITAGGVTHDLMDARAVFVKADGR